GRRLLLPEDPGGLPRTWVKNQKNCALKPSEASQYRVYTARMGERSDILVIGAGVSGLASALCLLERGRGVRVIDAGRVGGGSSHGNCGTLTPSHEIGRAHV